MGFSGIEAVEDFVVIKLGEVDRMGWPITYVKPMSLTAAFQTCGYFRFFADTLQIPVAKCVPQNHG
jgi:hypothetical protein